MAIRGDRADESIEQNDRARVACIRIAELVTNVINALKQK